MGNGAGTRVGSVHERTNATAGTDTVTGPETTHRERRGVEAIRLGGYGMCVLGIRHIQKSKGATGMRCRVERAGEETSQAGSRRWSRQSLSSLARSSTNGTINHQSSRSSEGIENHETDYVGAPNRQAGVDNGWETEERRPGLTSAPIASGSGRSGACARGLLCWSDFHWAGGLCCDGRRLPLALALSAPFRRRARSRAQERASAAGL